MDVCVQVAAHMKNWKDVRDAGILEMNGRKDIVVDNSVNAPKAAKLDRLFEEGSRLESRCE